MQAFYACVSANGFLSFIIGSPHFALPGMCNMTRPLEVKREGYGAVLPAVSKLCLRETHKNSLEYSEFVYLFGNHWYGVQGAGELAQSAQFPRDAPRAFAGADDEVLSAHLGPISTCLLYTSPSPRD